jgi:hypothetical protein
MWTGGSGAVVHRAGSPLPRTPVPRLVLQRQWIAGRFARSEPRVRAREYVSGLVAGLERKNGWTLAEQAGEVSPDGMQRLLRWAESRVAC